MDKTRLSSLSDAVFAVAITLLVLDVKIPDGSLSTPQLWHALQGLLPNIGAYILSFCIIGILWNGHHTIFNLVKLVDRTLIWLNLLYLMVVVFMPFPTAVLASHHNQQPAIILYSTLLILVGLLHRFFLYYIRHQPGIALYKLPTTFWRRSNGASLFGPACGTMAIIVSFVSADMSLIFLFAIPIYYIFINRTNDRLMKTIVR
ncbi:MAG TPA: TMEM175 family protein [Candidatus Saccharimonadales bacterium]|nr:TMEM175 family protein [Candidatus Saccharimonadales bacterium]